MRQLRRPESAGKRLSAHWPAELVTSGARLPCTVLDISRAGARLSLDGALGEAGPAELSLSRGRPIPASIAWRGPGGLAGIAFLAEQSWVETLARERFDASAWVRKP
ncbi:MAG TPA: PilZ domain-containing protein [Methylocella sp.]|nr:PilZ domain-containing protein [Methylocella sp.]